MTEKSGFGPVFSGVRLPVGAYLPVEIIQALPYMSLAETRVVLATVYHSLQFGGSEALTLSEFERLTGLTRMSVVSGIKAAMERGLLVRYPVPGYHGHEEFVYELNAYPDLIGIKNIPINPENPDLIGIKNIPINPENPDLIGIKNIPINPENPDLIGIKNIPISDIKLSTAVNNNNLINLTAAPLNLNGGKTKILNRLRGCGVYLTTAHELVSEHPAERIEAFLRLYPLAVRVYGVGPGWLVSAIRDTGKNPEDILADLQERSQEIADFQTEQSKTPSAKKICKGKSKLPSEVKSVLKALGWRGSLADVESAWREDAERVRQWLWYAKRQGWNGALLRTVLRNPGEYPPELNPDSALARRKYITGELADFIEC